MQTLGFELDQFQHHPYFPVTFFLFLTHFRGKHLEQLAKRNRVQKQLPSLAECWCFLVPHEVSVGSWKCPQGREVPVVPLGAGPHAVPVRHGVSEVRLCCWEGKA